MNVETLAHLERIMDAKIKLANAKHSVLISPESDKLNKIIEESRQVLLNSTMPEPIKDCPEMDATDFAHPAWWRGHEHTVNALCQKINQILDGQDDGKGISSEPWESVRRKLLDIMRLRHSRHPMN